MLWCTSELEKMQELAKFYARPPSARVACGRTHTIVCTRKGYLYGFGCNHWGQLGTIGTEEYYPSPVLIPFKEFVVAVSCGDEHTAIITRGGDLYCFGRNGCGQVGTDSNLKKVITPVHVAFEEEIASVACGFTHTAFITKSGRLYTFGDGRYGQLGNNMNFYTCVPTIVPFDQSFASVSCGYGYTHAVTKGGDLYSFGKCISDILGEANGTNSNIPARIELRDKALSSTCGIYNASIVTEDGSLYSFGINNNGLLGTSDDKNQVVPKLVKLEETVIAVSCGGIHTTIVTEGGSLHYFGGEEKRNAPALLPLAEKAVDVVCGSYHMIVIGATLNLYGCGEGDCGQIGTGKCDSVQTPTLISLHL